MFLTTSPGSVLFNRSNLLKRKDLCFSCLSLDLIRRKWSHSRSTSPVGRIFPLEGCLSTVTTFCDSRLSSTSSPWHVNIHPVTSHLLCLYHMSTVGTSRRLWVWKCREIVRYLRNWSVCLLEGSPTSDLRELSKFRDFSENRSVLFPFCCSPWYLTREHTGILVTMTNGSESRHLEKPTTHMLEVGHPSRDDSE